MAWKFQKEDGTLLDHAYMDGYSVGDRMLEGVIFKITITPDNEFRAEVTKSCEDYFSQLNRQKWLKEVEDYASQNDVFMETEKGGDDVVVFDEESGETCPNV